MPTTALPLSHLPNGKVKIVGLYGIPGCGKTTLLDQLRDDFNSNESAFCEGSDLLADQADGLANFKQGNRVQQDAWRKQAIENIRDDRDDSQRIRVVTGHAMFWPQGDASGTSVLTQADLDTFTHIVYLHVPVENIYEQISNDKERFDRLQPSIDHLRRWQQAEETELRQRCYRNGILLPLVGNGSDTLFKRVSHLLRHFRLHDEESDEQRTMDVVDTLFQPNMAFGKNKPDAMLVIDGDKTVAAEDTGELFWTEARSGQPDSLNIIFEDEGYSHSAFRQAGLRYTELEEDVFLTVCDTVASKVKVHSEFAKLLETVTKHEHVGVIVVTCGLRHVWQMVLPKLAVTARVKVICAEPTWSGDGNVVTPEFKAAIVDRLQTAYGQYVWVVGDSPLDLPMLKQANQAIVLVGDQNSRSKSMEMKLEHAIDKDLQARQLLLPNSAPPRLDASKLPIVKLSELEFVQALTGSLAVRDAINRTAAKLLMTPIRDASVQGPALREAYRQVGRYLATEFVSDIIGMPEHQIQHTQGKSTNGYRLFHESKTTIVADMQWRRTNGSRRQRDLPNSCLSPREIT